MTLSNAASAATASLTRNPKVSLDAAKLDDWFKALIKVVEAIAEADIDGEGFDPGDAHFTVADLRDEIRRGLDSLRQGPRQLHALELHHLLTRAVDPAGSEAALARSMGVTRQHLNGVRFGHKPAGPAILAHLGLRQVPAGRTLYTPTDG